MEQSTICSELLKCNFFKGMSPEQIESIAGICKYQSYEEGEHIFLQGSFGEHLYIIMEGYIFLERSMNIEAHKGGMVISALGKGRVLGSWSTLLGESHVLLSSATCQKKTHVLAIKGSDLRKMMIDNKALGFNVLESLCFLLRDRIEAAFGAMDKI